MRQRADAEAPSTRLAAEESPSAGNSQEMRFEEAAMLAALEREVFSARVRVQAAKMRLSMLRSSIQSDSMSRAEASLRRAAGAAEVSAMHPLLDAATIEHASRRRASEQLAQDLAAIDALEREAQQELAHLEGEVDRAERALAAWRERRWVDTTAAPEADAPSAGISGAGPAVIARFSAAPAAEVSALIANHRARLLAQAAEDAPVPGARP